MKTGRSRPGAANSGSARPVQCGEAPRPRRSLRTLAAPARVGRRPARDYPPMVIVSISLLALLAMLPSSLNLPQTNPTETLEYAPVPPDDETPPLQTGNLAAL